MQVEQEKNQTYDHILKEAMSLEPSDIHGLIGMLGRLAEGYIPPQIPDYLVDHNLALPITQANQISSWSAKVKMFNLITTANSEMRDSHQSSITYPQVTLLPHKLWEEWKKNGNQFEEQIKSELLHLFQAVIDLSPTRKIVIRHLEDSTDGSNTGVRSYPGIDSPEAALKALTKQFHHFAKLGWDHKGDKDVEVATGIYAHADPLEYRVSRKNGIQTLKSGQPPVGFVVTTRDSGSKINVEVVYGDNLAAQEVPGIADQYSFSVKSLVGDGSGPVKLDRMQMGQHTHIHLDRKGKIQKVGLQPQYHGAPVNIDDAKVSHAAIFAAIAAGMMGTDIKVEGSLNSQEKLEINSLAEYSPKKELPLEVFAKEYQAVAIINTLEEAKKFIRQYSNHNQTPELAPLIVLGDKIQNSTAVGAIADLLASFIKGKISNQPDSIWTKTLLTATGTSQSHHLDSLSNLGAEVHFYNAHRLPPIIPGDTIIPELNRHGNTIWLRNINISGDGDLVVTPQYWPKSFNKERIGIKAFHHYEDLVRPGHPTQPFTVITREGFLKILEHNSVMEIYQSIINNGLQNDKDALERAFKTIRISLKSLPPEILKQLSTILPRLVHNCDECLFIARSNSILEDEKIMGEASRMAGSFDSIPNLVFTSKKMGGKKKVRNTTPQPTTLEEGVLEVIASMFTDQMAKLLSSLKADVRKSALTRYAMPVEIDRQGSAIVSGVASAFDTDNNRSKEVITVSAQVGQGGVVDGVKIDRPIVILKADRQTRKLVSISLEILRQANGKRSTTTSINNIEELTHYGFPSQFNAEWIKAVMNTIDQVHKESGLKNIEWAIGLDDYGQLYLFCNQAR
jgi:hypothetical protein